MEKLKPMTDFVLEQSKLINDPEILARLLVSYAKFLKQHLSLSMFIHVNEQCEVLEEPINDDFYYWEWKEAEKNILFEGFSLESIRLNEESYADIDGYICRGSDFFIHRDNINYQTIEFLFNYAQDLGFEIKLTESAKKQISI